VSPTFGPSSDPLTHSSLAVGGQAYTILTSEGGQALTLAGSGAGVVTSVFGSVYTVATSAAASAASSATSNAAYGSPSLGFTSSHALGIATLIGGTLVGALMTL
jgi:hypothetical protein